MNKCITFQISNVKKKQIIYGLLFCFVFFAHHIYMVPCADLSENISSKSIKFCWCNMTNCMVGTVSCWGARKWLSKLTNGRGRSHRWICHLEALRFHCHEETWKKRQLSKNIKEQNSFLKIKHSFSHLLKTQIPFLKQCIPLQLATCKMLLENCKNHTNRKKQITWKTIVWPTAMHFFSFSFFLFF